MTGRAVKEWIGKTPDSKVPPRVRLRIFQREGGICHISKRKIGPGEPWQLDHDPALINGGQNRESMLFPALVDKHKEKTKDDVGEKSSVASKAKKHVGAVRPKGQIKSRGFEKSDKTPKIDKSTFAPLGPSAIARRFGL